ncbi:MAG: DegV family protein [Candidatus Izemoplasmatales bacterium]|nr:DegV family protein [Candidatus Izemoplasmatales bacterium]MDD4069653.1 DegV family protein [Candidatus Izemoplasmatales bacterium]
MKKLGLMVCTNSSIDYLNFDFDVTIIRSMVIMGSKEYIDYEELTAQEFYDMIEKDPTIIPRTAMASTGTMVEAYEKLRDSGCDTIIFVTISSKMSGIYENAVLAKKMVEGVDIHVFDSKSVGYIESAMVFKAHEGYKNGKSIEEIIKDLEYIRDNNKIYFAVNDLKFLIKNGRLSNAAGFMANMLKIKPLLEIDKSGAVVSIEKIRTFSRAVDRVIEKFMEETKDKSVEAFIIHANNPETTKYIRAKVLELRPELGEIKDYLLTPAVGAHSGPGAITIGYILNK